VWVFDEIPGILRVQVSNIIRGAMGSTNEYAPYNALETYKFLRDSVAHHHGRHSLCSESGFVADVHMCLQTEREIPVWLDVVELSFRLIERARAKVPEHLRDAAGIKIPADEAIDELNERFRRAAFGYRYERGVILRIDNEFTHQAATRPALELLSDPRFSGPEEEFRAAHDHFKAGEYKDCAVDALNALESTMKTICDTKGWHYPKGARASDLLKILRKEKLFPEFADQSFEQLLATLKSGLPAVRNQAGGHGQGAIPVQVPDYVAVYALNLAASKIRFLVEAFKQSEK
jgi:hypothetical protein